MKKILLFFFASALAFMLAGPGAWAQESSSKDEFTLPAITVTAEKRATNLQDLASSVASLPGNDLTTQGKITTPQILESVPNVTFRDGGGTNPNGNIAIRGIQRTQESGGTNDVLPATTAVYVDGVYQGIGGNYDVDRVEVLRGPQGTLYGRSATGGVISFHTNDPKLNEFSGNVSAEYGTANLYNIEGAVNVPAGQKVALRAAAHYFSRDGYFDAKGGRTKTKEGRLKVLFQPTGPLQIVLSGSAQETTDWGGGYTATLTGPDKIDYKGSYSVAEEGAPQKYKQLAINANYDLGNSTVTYIGGYHDYDYTGLGAEAVKGGKGHRDLNEWPTDYYHSEEIRWASNSGQQLTWLVGANYFKHKFDTSIFSTQTIYPEDPELPAADGYLVPIWGRQTKGTFDNYGLFTEETYNLRDNFRVTAGLRYDNTKLDQSIWYYQNQNVTTLGNSKNPPDYSGVGTSELIGDKHEYNNVTYKLRFEYDLTPDNMLYLLTATGFMPGYTALSPTMNPDNPWQFLRLDQQKLTSYEFGTKNQFLDNTLRLNASIFYYDYAGYPEAVNLRAGQGPPTFTVIAVPLEVIGLEVEGEYLITMNDRLTGSFGYLDAKITDTPDSVIWSYFGPLAPDPENPSYTTPGSYAFMLNKLPGNAKIKATVAYDHTFMLNNGSTLVPRAEFIYTGGYYLSQMTYLMTDLGEKPYDHQDGYVLCNLGATWTSPSLMYSITGYARNAFDQEYKAGVSLNSTSISPIGVTPGDPRTFGVMVNVKF